MTQFPEEKNKIKESQKKIWRYRKNILEILLNINFSLTEEEKKMYGESKGPLFINCKNEKQYKIHFLKTGISLEKQMIWDLRKENIKQYLRGFFKPFY